MPWFAVVLYLHLVAVVAAFAYASYIHLGLERLQHAETTADASSALQLCARGGAKMPWVGLALLFTGAYLTQAAFAWSTPWIDLSILGLLAIEAVGAVSGARRRRLALALRQSQLLRLDAALLRAARDPLSRTANYLLPLLTLGIMLLMVIKPAFVASVVILLAATLCGVMMGRRGTTVREQESISA